MTGIGGVFFRAKDPESVGRWYVEHLGVTPTPRVEGDPEWWQQEGPTVLAAVPADTEDFTGPDQACMLNFRVANLDAMLAQLRAAGVEVGKRAEEHSYGRFGWAIDPEGNRVELWEPSESVLRRS